MCSGMILPSQDFVLHYVTPARVRHDWMLDTGYSIIHPPPAQNRKGRKDHKEDAKRIFTL
jgi:hypothetical protein